MKFEETLARFSDPDPDAVPRDIVPVARHAVRLPLALARDSRFLGYHLAEHVGRYPDLVYRNATNEREYIVGGLWRQRGEIGAILEMVASVRRGELLERLLEAYRARGVTLAVVDPREQERNLAFYRTSHFTVIDSIIQMERRGLRVERGASVITIRAMREADVPAVLAVERHSFPWLWWNSEAELRSYASVSGVELYVAEAANAANVVAYVGFTVFDRQAHLDRLAVDKDHQRRGYARALLTFAMHRMDQLGAQRVALTTQLDNRASQSLYKTLGFRESEWRHDILGIWLR